MLANAVARHLLPETSSLNTSKRLGTVNSLHQGQLATVHRFQGSQPALLSAHLPAAKPMVLHLGQHPFHPSWARSMVALLALLVRARTRAPLRPRPRHHCRTPSCEMAKDVAVALVELQGRRFLYISSAQIYLDSAKPVCSWEPSMLDWRRTGLHP